jgi:hypothetical protein
MSVCLDREYVPLSFYVPAARDCGMYRGRR